ncbi:uncharacterized protein BP01DRAFT_134178 [Aspergillus saccharolyticus JOP 1030-1]|uniref:Uncharacterized protein n=1 Tax=Aspergillus saccharolyticus JOP 1030-1 TaxID=1450539 RepID=A0A319A570_9EURO|nr:hypothetical protein BP01DRAFT_134178 [Aspergillus saccharolyticus JOP 1030-1]PYH42562.1 hypothetical protein BP01DRAFT_134178 [Aspergillus saccharolyticus JOP 1030-1]
MRLPPAQSARPSSIAPDSLPPDSLSPRSIASRTHPSPSVSSTRGNRRTVPHNVTPLCRLRCSAFAPSPAPSVSGSHKKTQPRSCPARNMTDMSSDCVSEPWPISTSTVLGRGKLSSLT